MIVLTDCDGKNNIIQLILGPSVDIHISLNGAIKIDIDNIIEKFNNDLPIKIVITRTNNENQLMQLMSNMTFIQHINEDEDEEEIVDEEQVNNFLDSLKKNVQSKLKYGEELEDVEHDDPRGHYAKLIICPKCNNHGVFLKPETPALCADCLKIESGLGNLKSKK